MKSSITFLFVLSFQFLFSFDETNGTAARLSEVQKRTLIVELPIKSPNYIKELQKRNKLKEIEDYEKRCIYIRESIKTAFTKFWDFNEKIVFISSDSISSYFNANENLYAVMRYGNRSKFFVLGEKYETNYIMAYDRPRAFTLFLADEKSEVLFLITPLKAALGEFVQSVDQFKLSLKVYLSHPDIKQTNVNAYVFSKEDKPRYEVKKLTALIKKDDIIKVLEQQDFSEEKIAKAYPYNFKIVEQAEWEKAILNHDAKYACLTAYYFPVSNNVCEVSDNFHSVNNDKTCEGEGGRIIQIFGLHAASDGLSQGADPGKKIEKIMGGIAKMLDKMEEKAKEADFKPH